MSERESEVLALLASGLSNAGIAQNLSITKKTVESVLSSVFLKLGFSENDSGANRRVKAAMHFVSVRKPPMAAPLGFDGSETLIAAAPFDTLSTVLEQRASDAGAGAWRLLAAASWCMAIGDNLTGALSLARRAHRQVADVVDSDPVYSGSDSGWDSGWRSALIIVDGLVGTLGAMLGYAPVAHDALDQIIDLASLPPHDPQRMIFDLMNPILEIANWFTFGDRAPDAAAILDRAMYDPAALDHFAEGSALGCLVELNLRRGRWKRCDDSLRVLFELESADAGPSGYAHSLAARLHAGRGDQSRTSSHLRSARAGALSRADHSSQWRADAAEGLLLLGSGDYARAAAVLSHLGDPASCRMPRLPSMRMWDVDLVESQCRSGDWPGARRTTQRLREDVVATGSQYGEAALRRADGLLADTQSFAVTSLEESAQLFARLDAPFEQARSELLLAARLAHGGLETDSSARLTRAHGIFESLGAIPWLHKCTALADQLPA